MIRFLDLLWKIIPLWLGTLIANQTGFIFAKRTTEGGKSLQYYFSRNLPPEFGVKK